MTTEEAVETDFDRTIKLRKRVRGSSALAASLRERVRGPISKEVAVDVQALAASLRERVKGSDAGPKAPAPEALTAARRPWNPLLHPRGADGRFIEIGSWVRWLRQGFGSTRRGQVVDIIPDPKSKSRDGVNGRVLARVEFPDRDGQTVTYDVSFDELEKVAPPKGSVSDTDALGDSDGGSNDAIAKKIAAKTIGHLVRDDEHHVGDGNGGHSGAGTEDGNDTINQLDPSEQDEVEDAIGDAVGDAIAESVPDTPSEIADPTDDQLEAEEIANLGVDGADGGADPGRIETPYVPPSDEWEKTSDWFEDLQGEDSPASEALVDGLRPDSFSETSEWADAVRQARSRYESWRSAQLAEDEDADVSLDAYLDWLESQGLNAALVAGLRSEARVRGSRSLLARATEYWTKEKRAQAAREGLALPTGEYPIEDVEDLRKALQSYGRARDPHTTKRHIIRRANLLGSLGLLPSGWVGHGFDPARHLRGPDGKFISQGGPPRKPRVASSGGNEAERLRGRVHGTR